MTVRIIIGDAIQELCRIPDASIDAVITDPPYCSGALSEAGKSRATHQGLRSETVRAGRFAWFEGDNMTTAGLAWLLRELAIESFRVLKPSGHLLVFCDWRMVPTLAPALESAGLRLRNLIVWDKGQFGAGIGFRPTHELIIHLTRSDPEFHAADIGNVLRFSRVHTTRREHPAEKPIDLIRSLIRVTSPVGGTICDPFAGSGTAGVAAKMEGRNAVLVERSAEWAAVAEDRVSAAGPLFRASQAGMFDDAPLEAAE